MFAPGDRVVAGVSGGPDSVAMLLWLAGFAREEGLQVHVAHLDHMLRGEESTEDARWVGQLAATLGLESTIEAMDVLALRERERLSLEDAGRQARYSFFAGVVRTVGASCVAVAHTSDDQVETVVLHWLRGAGLRGLRGMKPVMTYRVKPNLGREEFDLKVVRPLLDVPRSEVESYLDGKAIAPRVDRTNEETIFRRNRIRRDLIPTLETYNPRFKESILRSARVLAADFDFIQESVAQAWDRVARTEDARITFDLSRWRDLSESIRRHLLREAFSRLAGDVVGLGSVHIDLALSGIGSGRTGTAIAWPRGITVKKGYDSFSLGFREERPEAALSTVGQHLEIPGRTIVFGTEWEVDACVGNEPCPGGRGPLQAELDYRHVGSDLVVRRRRPGDRFRPLGMKGEKSLQDFFVDAKVPEEERDDVPIVSSSAGVVWVVGHRIDDRAKVMASTSEFLCLRFVKYSDGGIDSSEQVLQRGKGRRGASKRGRHREEGS